MQLHSLSLSKPGQNAMDEPEFNVAAALADVGEQPIDGDAAAEEAAANAVEDSAEDEAEGDDAEKEPTEESPEADEENDDAEEKPAEEVALINVSSSPALRGTGKAGCRQGGDSREAAGDQHQKSLYVPYGTHYIPTLNVP